MVKGTMEIGELHQTYDLMSEMSSKKSVEIT
jgi:hypothetical protein